MKDARDNLIIELLRNQEYAMVEEIAEKLYCSPSTVRRRLANLQTRGLVVRTHGGAALNQSDAVVEDFTYRKDRNAVGKRKIALEAAKLIKEGDVIFLDDSSTVFYMVPYIAEFKNVQVFTNGVDTLSMLCKFNVKAYSTGGEVDETNRSALIGEFAERTVENVFFDLMFFANQCVNENGVITDCSTQGNVLRRKAIKNSKQKIFLCDFEKFGKTSVFKTCDVSEVDCIISDKPITNFIKREDMPKVVFVE